MTATLWHERRFLTYFSGQTVSQFGDRITELAVPLIAVVTLRSREGMRFVLHHPYLRASLGCATTGNFFSLVVGSLMILFASREPHLSAGVIGLALGTGAIGGVIGALVAGRLGRRFGVGRTIAWGSVFICAPCVLVPFATGSLWMRACVLGAIEFLIGIGVMCFDVNLNALQTVVTPDAMQPGLRRLHHDQLRHPAARRSRRRPVRPVLRDRSDHRGRRHRRLAGVPLAAAVADHRDPYDR